MRHEEKFGWEFAAVLSHLFSSHFAMKICVNLTCDTSCVSRKKKLMKFVYFLQKQPFADVLQFRCS